MKRPELVSRILILAAIVGAIGLPLYFWSRASLIHARSAEDGGWSPDVIKAKVNEPLSLQLTSDDVVHGFAVGQMDMQSVDVLPGKVTNISLVFDRPGIYTFFCTRWCGVNHWRMRGTIEVSGSNTEPEPASVPLYLDLGLDIDAPHNAPRIPGNRPSAINAQPLESSVPIDLSSAYYRSHSPYEVFDDLDNLSLSEQQRWDAVAYIWKSNTSPESLSKGKQLYTLNCAACHGENGAGDGVFADDLTAAGESSAQMMGGTQGMTVQAPANFSDPRRMLGASPALLQGKILRGGMGTGMPMWGTIITEEQIWDLIAYLYSFQFAYPN